MKEKVKKILAQLATEYPNPKSELIFNSPYELLVAVILSAQCTDKRVNSVTKTLFSIANTPESMAQLPIEQLETLIHSCGFYANKARFVHNSAVDIVQRFNGEVPQTIAELMTLDGVGKKTADVVYAVGFNGQAIAVDTHVFRVSNRLGIVRAKTPLETEKQLEQEIDKNMWRDSHHWLLLHGRYTCKSQRPLCNICQISQYCDYFKKIGSLKR